MNRFSLLLYCTLAYCGAASAGVISLQPSTTSLTTGGSVTVDVNISGISDLYAFQFDIGFNPAVLSAISVTEGALFSSVGVFFSPGFIDNVGGTITFIGDSLSGPGPGVGTDGTLASILFSGIGAGTSALTLANVVLLDSSLSDITATVAGTSVDVTAGAVPEPATWVLVLPFLVVVGLRVRFNGARVR